MSQLAKTPKPPYYAVVFTSERTAWDNGYGEMAEKMVELASQQPGFLGVESARENGLGITVSYWESLEAIKNWKENELHQIAQTKGKEQWYQRYTTRVCKVERDYTFRGRLLISCLGKQILIKRKGAASLSRAASVESHFILFSIRAAMIPLFPVLLY